MSEIGFIYFIYLFLYSGLEFTLPFLTYLRFQFDRYDFLILKICFRKIEISKFSIWCSCIICTLWFKCIKNLLTLISIAQKISRIDSYEGTWQLALLNSIRFTTKNRKLNCRLKIDDFSMQQGRIYLFVGLLMLPIQGGLVRRTAMHRFCITYYIYGPWN